MADWPPRVGSKWRDSRDHKFTRTVTCVTKLSVHVDSEWTTHRDGKAKHSMMLMKKHWERWPGEEMPAFT